MSVVCALPSLGYFVRAALVNQDGRCIPVGKPAVPPELSIRISCEPAGWVCTQRKQEPVSSKTPAGLLLTPLLLTTAVDGKQPKPSSTIEGVFEGWASHMAQC